MKILDFQALTLGHPALDIWTMVYSATDPEYRAAHLEADLRAYFTVLTTYMEEANPDFTEFMQEVEERRVYGMVLFSKLLTHINSLLTRSTTRLYFKNSNFPFYVLGGFCFVTLSPTPLPSPAKEPSKFSAACNEILLAEESEGDHPDIR